jgi:hypothetical protein
MRSSTFFSVAAFAAAAVAQDSVSQCCRPLPAPRHATNTPPQSVSSAAAAVTSSIDAFPQTSFLTATNSLGVVTGQPAADTAIPTQPPADTVIPTQPAVETNVGTAVTIPAVGTGIHTIPVPNPSGNGSVTITVSANNSTTVILGAPTGSASGSGADASNTASTTRGSQSGSVSGSPTGSGASSSSTAGASNIKVAAGSMVGFGAFVAAFL